MKPPVSWEDPLYWLRDDDRKSEEVFEHLRAENAYTEAKTAHLADFREALNTELRSHMQETDETYPMARGAFEYYKRTVEGLSYAIRCRRPRGGGEEVVLLDENELAKGRPYCSVGAAEPSPSQKLYTFTADYTGYETYDLYVCAPGEPPAADAKPELNGIADFAWGAADDSEIYYTVFDEAHRPYAVWRHVLGTSQEEDVKVFSDDNQLFNVDVSRSRDGELVFITSASTETSEVHYVRLTGGESVTTQCIRPRETGVRYFVDHRRGSLLIVTNEGGQKNQVLRQCKLADVADGPDAWEPVMLSKAEGEGLEEMLPHSEWRYLEDVDAFDGFVVVSGREEGMSQVWVLEGRELDEHAKLHRVEWPDDAHYCSLDSRAEFSSEALRVVYSTLVLPPTDMDYHVAEKRLETLRTKPVPNYDPSKYATTRLLAKAFDGVEIPISLFWRRDLRNVSSDGFGDARDLPEEADAPFQSRAVHLDGYGSYGISSEPYFSMTRLPLVDRGVIFAIAHIRGGGEMGRWKWYEEQGKYLQKKNTFKDFVACAEHLIAHEIASGPQELSIQGASAGGLLVTAALNMRPDLFCAVVAGVPFVDVLVTMSDPSIPLTCGEWEEWGNPNESKYFEYMQSYSPIDNIRRQPYPSVLITAGLHDPRVAYWEPAKYAQALRAQRTNEPDDGTSVLLKMDLSVGHFSASDRYKYLREKAFEQAWLLAQLCLGPEEKD